MKEERIKSLTIKTCDHAFGLRIRPKNQIVAKQAVSHLHKVRLFTVHIFKLVYPVYVLRELRDEI